MTTTTTKDEDDFITAIITITSLRMILAEACARASLRAFSLPGFAV
jgi:hypothetical protein